MEKNGRFFTVIGLCAVEEISCIPFTTKKDAADWVGALKGRTFHGGSSPDLADLAVFGVIRSITGTDTFNDLMHNTDIGSWYEAMFNAVGESSRITDKP